MSCWSFFLLSSFACIDFSGFGEDFCDNTCCNCLATLSKGKPGALGDGERVKEFALDCEIISRLGNLCAFRELDFNGSISSFEIELGSISTGEGILPTSFFRGETINVCFDHRVCDHGAWFGDD